MSISKKNPLARLSDNQLIQNLDSLVQKEQETTLDILRHLIEMDRRSLYLARGYASLFEYGTRHLGYSESAAMRRIKTARCMRDFPGVFGMLSRNELNLTTASMLAEVLSEENERGLLHEARHKSTRQVDKIIARYNPGSVIRDRVRPVYIKTLADAPARVDQSASGRIEGEDPIKAFVAVENDDASINHSDQKFTASAGGRTFTTFTETNPQREVLEEKFKLEFAVNAAFMKKLEEVKALLSTKYPRGVSFERLFEAMLDEFLEKHSPQRKMQRRKSRGANQKGHPESSPAIGKTKRTREKDLQKLTSPGVNIQREINELKKSNCDGRHHSRHIPAAIRDRVFARDGRQCTFVGTNGIRCGSTWDLQIDHIKPFARGGSHAMQNLRLLCAKHNMHEAKRVYGKEVIERRMHAPNRVYGREFMELRRDKQNPIRE
ncbi:MAG: HNH endonuclease signature motif containing protein [Candidatus Latescibacterota bacterium]